MFVHTLNHQIYEKVKNIFNISICQSVFQIRLEYGKTSC